MKKILLLLFILITFSCKGQNSMSGNLESFIDTFIKDMSGKDTKEYTVPSLGKLTKWEKAIYSIIHNDLHTADSLLALINYTRINYHDNEVNEDYYVLYGTLYGVYVFNRDAERPNLIIQVPHPLNDLYTGQEGIYMFKRLDAKAFFIAGTHRYNNSVMSDVAHNNNNYFQVATEVVYDEFPKTTFIQLHGFAQKEADPDIVISYGVVDTNYFYSTSPALIVKMHLFNLLNVLVNDNGQHRLTAYTNTQGRYINQTSNHQFIHIEQAFRVRQDYWKELLSSLETAFPAMNKNTIINVKDKNGAILFYLNLNGEFMLLPSTSTSLGEEYIFQKQ